MVETSEWARKAEKDHARLSQAFKGGQFPPLPGVDREGQRLYFRACDLAARFWLNSRAMLEFDAGNFDGCGMLYHAMVYLADRLAYELAPWPKGKIKVEDGAGRAGKP